MVNAESQLRSGVYSCCKCKRRAHEPFSSLSLSRFRQHRRLARTEPDRKTEDARPRTSKFYAGDLENGGALRTHGSDAHGGTAFGTEIWRPGPGGMSVIEESSEKNAQGTWLVWQLRGGMP